MYDFIPRSGNADVSKGAIENSYKKALETIQGIYPKVAPETIDFIRERSKMVYFKENSIILDYEQVNSYCLFICSGLMRSCIKYRGRQYTSWYMAAGDMVIAANSWYDQTPSTERLMAMKDTFCIALHYNDLEYIYQRWEGFNLVGRKFTEKYYIQARQMTHWRFFAPLYVYKIIIKQYWNIARQVPLAEISNFLGVARETLSRIRNKRWKDENEDLSSARFADKP
ncbi:Crp/Fnr family transcriptional regulator [Chitinophaga barathri]|uniref:Crp/Fnr family transcriptional regulator n=1 Tax=Chitinophaga barathri TaxID=1647451 RepID=A0A3N4M7D3_9BACT|nr:Crp/Fnr family transcriptional regulator [Chitinophaga barathri]RPD39332.1 Crp/Fnr family transcriptional regulator [Chitinophaga barathri]